MTTTLIRNIGDLVSGDVNAGLLDADSVLIREGKIAAYGLEKDVTPEGVDHVVDVCGMALAPGLIDAHTHQVIGDWHPRQSVIGWMEGVLHGGVTTILTMGASMLQGLPRDAAGTKALAILGAKTGQNFRPGGGLKVHGGAVILRPGLTQADFEEMAREGVKVVAEIGGGGLHRYEDVKDYVNWAREAGMIIPMHFGGRSVPGSARLYADEIIALKPDVVVHINGGPTSAPQKEAERLIEGTSAYLEVIHTGNYRTMHDFVMLMKER
ncbi:MAG: Enamidase, partial [bacterium]